MTSFSARSISVNFYPKKNLTSNVSKPIGVLTHTKFLCYQLPPTHRLLPARFSASSKQFFCSNHRRRRRRRHDQAGRGSTRKKTMPIRLMDQSELFVTTKLIAIWFIANLDQLSHDSRKDQKKAWNLTSNCSIPIYVLTHKNSLVSNDSYRKVFDRTITNFYIGASIGSMSKLIFFYVSKDFNRKIRLYL